MSPEQRISHPDELLTAFDPALELALLERQPGHLTLINTGVPGDVHWGLRTRELTRRLGQEVEEVRLESEREKRQRRERSGGYNSHQHMRR